MMKRLLLLALVLLLPVLAAACAPELISDGDVPMEAPSEVEIPPAVAEDEPTGVVAELSPIALVLDASDPAEDSYGAQLWAGIEAFSLAKDISAAFYSPEEAADPARVDAMARAVENGAEVIICYGGLYEAAVYECQYLYPHVIFLLFEGQPHAADYSRYATEANVLTLGFSQEQAGFLAGYAAVREGYTDLGYFAGIAVAAAVRYGTGFLQGAYYAAQELSTPVTVTYFYSGMSAADETVQSAAGSWFVNNVQLIFSSDPAFTGYITAAGESTGGKVISVDTSSGPGSPALLASTVKDVAGAVQDQLTRYIDGQLSGGRLTLGVAQQRLTMDMANATFANFTRTDYVSIVTKLSDSQVKVEIIEDPTVDVTELYGDWVTVIIPE